MNKKQSNQFKSYAGKNNGVQAQDAMTKQKTDQGPQANLLTESPANKQKGVSLLNKKDLISKVNMSQKGNSQDQRDSYSQPGSNDPGSYRQPPNKNYSRQPQSLGNNSNQSDLQLNNLNMNYNPKTNGNVNKLSLAKNNRVHQGSTNNQNKQKRLQNSKTMENKQYPKKAQTERRGQYPDPDSDDIERQEVPINSNMTTRYKSIGDIEMHDADASASMQTRPIEQQNTFEAQDEGDQIPLPLFTRLTQCGIVQLSTDIKQNHLKDTVALDRINYMRFQNASIFAAYLLVQKQRLRKYNQEIISNTEALQSFMSKKDAKLEEVQNKPSQRLKNWNIVCEELDKIGLIIDGDAKTLYVAGEIQEIVKLFHRIDRYVGKITLDTDLDFSDYRIENKPANTQYQVAEMDSNDPMAASLDDEVLIDDQASGGSPVRRSGKQAQMQKQFASKPKSIKDGVDILKMTSDKSPAETESTLEFILNTLSRAMNFQPRQAAALLTNNNQFLLKICTRGIKGKHEPIINWYMEMFQYSQFLSQLIATDVQNTYKSGDQKKIDMIGTNFGKVLQTLSCGCYSQNQKVTETALRLLGGLAQDFSADIELYKLAYSWVNNYKDEQAGCFAVNYTIERHPELIRNYVSTILKFAQSGNAIETYYLETLKNFFEEPEFYIQSLLSVIQCKDDLLKAGDISGFLRRMVTMCQELLELQSPPPRTRIACLTLLSDIWVLYQDQIKNQDGVQPQIFHALKPTLADRFKVVQIVACISLFRVLEAFAAQKHKFAPQILKALISAVTLVGAEGTVRETYFSCFRSLFNTSRNIPVGIVTDQLMVLYNKKLQLQTYDFDYFHFVAEHPKTNERSALLLTDMLSKVYMDQLSSANAVRAPLLKLVDRFIASGPTQEWVTKYINQCLNQYMYLIDPELAIAQERQQSALNALEPPPGSRGKLGLSDKYSSFDRRSNLLLNNDYMNIQERDTPGRGPDGVKFDGNSEQRRRHQSEMASYANRKPKDNAFNDFMNTKEEAEADCRLRKALLMQILMDLVSMVANYDQTLMHAQTQNLLLKCQCEHENLKESKSKGVEALLNQHFFNDQDRIDGEYEAFKREHLKKQVALQSNEIKALTYDAEDPYNAGAQTGKSQGQTTAGNARQLRSLNHKSGKFHSAGQAPDGLKALSERKLPKIGSLHPSGLSQRTVHELEQIKQLRIDQEKDIGLKKERELMKSNRSKDALSLQLKMRRVQLGIPENKGGVRQEVSALVVKEGEALGDYGSLAQLDSENRTNKLNNSRSQRSQVKLPALQYGDSAASARVEANSSFRRKRMPEPQETMKLVKLDDEEGIERTMLAEFMKNYAKTWQFLFHTYQNSAYQSKMRSNFDELNQRMARILLPEVVMMLRDHDICPQLIKKDEVGTIVKLINLESVQKGSTNIAAGDIQAMNLQQFHKCIQQLAFLCFQRPPQDYRHLPLVSQMKMLLHHFEKGAEKREKPTALFIDPKIVENPFEDKQLLYAFEEQLQKDPNMILPDGFKKKIEKTPIVEYKLPSFVLKNQKCTESKIIAVETLDEILYEILGTHFLEPQIGFVEKVRVITSFKRDPAGESGLASSGKKVPVRPYKVGIDYRLNYEKSKPKPLRPNYIANIDPNEKKPELGVALKVAVATKPLKERPYYTEVAETFEEMLRAVNDGQRDGNLKPRDKKIDLNARKNQAKRDKEIRAQEEEAARSKKEQIRKERDFAVKKIIGEGQKKPAEDEEARKKREEEQKAERERKAQAAQEKKEFFAKQKDKLSETFKKKADDQKAQAETDKQKEERDKQLRDKLKQKAAQNLKTKGDSESKVSGSVRQSVTALPNKKPKPKVEKKEEKKEAKKVEKKVEKKEEKVEEIKVNEAEDGPAEGQQLEVKNEENKE